MLKHLLHGILLDDDTPDLPGSGGADTAVATPPAATGAPELSGIDKATAEFDALVGQLEPKEAKAKEPADKPGVEKGKEKVADKPKEKAVEKTPDDPEEAALEKLIKPHQGAYKAFQAFKKTTVARAQAREKELTAKLEALEKRPQTGANDAKIAEAEKQLKELRETLTAKERALAEVDYSKSSEFQDKFTKRAQGIYAEAAAFVKGLKVVDADGNPVRDGTEADFNMVRAQPLQGRRAVAKQLFGDNAEDVLVQVRDLDRVIAESRQAIEQHASQYETKRQEQERLQAEQQGNYSKARDAADSHMAEKFPQYANPEHYKDQPELKAALERGLSFVDAVTKSNGTMKMEDRAAAVASLRVRAGAFELNVAQLRAANARIAELEAEIASGRESDPANLKEKAGNETNTGDSMPKGIEDAANEFNTLK